MKYLPVVFSIFLTGLVGCGSGDSGGGGGDALASAPETAEAAVQNLVNGIENGDAVVAWNALPESYQNDVNGIVRDFGTNMDPVLWKQITDLLGSVQKLLVDKQEFITNHPGIATGPNPEFAKAAIPKIAGMLESILATGSDLEGLKTFDGAEFTKTTGSDFLKQTLALTALAPQNVKTGPAGLASLKDVKVETIESTDTTATLKMNFADGKVENWNFVKKDEKWLPEDMVKEWDGSIASAKQSLATLPEQLPAMKGQVGMVLGMAGGMIAPLQNAADQDQFNTAVDNLQGGIMGMIMMSGMGGAQNSSPVPTTQAAPEAPPSTSPGDQPATQPEQ